MSKDVYTLYAQQVKTTRGVDLYPLSRIILQLAMQQALGPLACLSEISETLSRSVSLRSRGWGQAASLVLLCNHCEFLRVSIYGSKDVAAILHAQHQEWHHWALSFIK